MHFSTINEFTELPWRIRSDMGFQQLLQFLSFQNSLGDLFGASDENYILI